MKKILIVDDSSFMRTVLKDLLTDQLSESSFAPIEIFEADGKVNALRQLKEVNPNLILLDIVMQDSEKEGLEFIEEIKDFYDIEKIIIISSIGQIAILDECKKLGITSYLHKPFDKEQVIEAIHKSLTL